MCVHDLHLNMCKVDAKIAHCEITEPRAAKSLAKNMQIYMRLKGRVKLTQRLAISKPPATGPWRPGLENLGVLFLWGLRDSQVANERGWNAEKVKAERF